MEERTAPILIYTAIIGGYDILRDPVLSYPDVNFDRFRFICFTDQDLSSNYWEIRKVSPDYDCTSLARKIKWMPYIYAPDLDWSLSIWHDGSIVLGKDPLVFMPHVFEDHYGFKLHPSRANIVDEAKAIEGRGLCDREILDHQLEAYKEIDPESLTAPLIETDIFFRRRSEVTDKLEESMYRQLMKYSRRDQMALPPLISVFGPRVQYIPVDIANRFHIKYLHRGGEYPQIRFITPYAQDGNLGAAYNRAADGLGPDDWVALMDGDSMFTSPIWGKRISATIAKNEDKFDIFAPVTNRLNSLQQRYGLFECRDLVDLHDKEEQAWEKFNTKCREAYDPPAGLMMIMRKWVLDTIQFKNGLVFIDTDFMIRAKQFGLRIGIMDGVHITHYYRLHKDQKDINHLL